MKRFASVVALAVAAACTPIEPVPLSNAPINRCSCEAFGAAASCDSSLDRCQIAGRPQFPFFVVAHVPDSSGFAPAQTFVLFSGQGGAPTFTRTQTATVPTVCTGQKCAEVGGLTLVTNLYRVSADQSARVGFPLKDGQRIPVRVEYELLYNTTDATAAGVPQGLPIQTRFVAPRLGPDGAETSTTLPSGRYRRIMYPQPPFDAIFPPKATPAVGTAPDDTLQVRAADPATRASLNSIVDDFLLTAAALDPAESRGVTVQRENGLDGWQVWVADTVTTRRISTLKTLSGTTQMVTLDTTGELRSTNGGLGDNVEVVVSPPASYIGVPRFVNPVNAGDLGTIKYPFVYPPVKVNGNVVQRNDATLGFAARLSFESATIETPRESSPSSPLLHYSTTLSTDDRGLFATVLPPGTYNVTIEPLQGTGFATARQIVVVARSKCRDDPDDPNGCTALTLPASKRTFVRGRVVVADGRPMAEVDILATPKTPVDVGVAKPRPSQTRTDLDGRFSLELDQGSYFITAIPKADTGFPNRVIRSEISAGEADLTDIVIPAPIALQFTLRDPVRPRENVIANAIVRVFALPGVTLADSVEAATADAVEIGLGTTGADGHVEILLAPGPP